MNSKINSLTSLRFFAAMLIVIGHGSQIPAFKSFEFGLFNVGNSVSFFYVLSGFILTYNYYSMTDYRSYLVARIARVWPLHLTMLIVVIFALNYDVRNLSVLLANALAIQSWFPYSNYFYSYNAVSWSISTEISFYVAFPLFLWMLKNNIKSLITVALLFLLVPLSLCVFTGIPVKPSPDYISSSFWLYINPICRSVEFISGMVACNLFLKQKSSNSNGTSKEMILLIVMIISMFTTNHLWYLFKDGRYAAFFGWLATAGSFVFIALFIHCTAKGSGLISKSLSAKWLVYLGEISFSMYMCHQVILNFINKYFSEESVLHSEAFYILYLTSVVVMSSALFHLVEVPARKAIRGMLSRRQVTA